MVSVYNISNCYINDNENNMIKKNKNTYNYYICVKTGALMFNIPKFKDENIKFEAKGTLKEDKSKEFGIHLC